MKIEKGIQETKMLSRDTCKAQIKKKLISTMVAGKGNFFFLPFASCGLKASHFHTVLRILCTAVTSFYTRNPCFVVKKRNYRGGIPQSNH